MFKDMFKDPAKSVWVLVLLTTLAVIAGVEMWDHLFDREWVLAGIVAVLFAALTRLLTGAMSLVQRRLEAGLSEARSCVCGEITTLRSPTDTAAVDGIYHRGDGPCFVMEDPVKDGNDG